MDKLFARQLAKSLDANGKVDLDQLGTLVTEAYTSSDRDRRRTDRSISLMIGELDELNRNLEQQVAERTTALRENEAQLKAQNMRFDAAINNMNHALLMFDRDAKLVIWNKRYLEMYGVPEDAVRVGSTLLELLEMRQRLGMLDAVPEEAAATILAEVRHGASHHSITELTDGRTISASIHPTPDGGWVATHEDISDRMHVERRIAHMARHDALTDLPNRILVRERLGETIERLQPDERVAIHYLDIDHFKTINDTLGHSVGDELLKAVAGRLSACVDDSQTVARIGGDEFAVIQPGIAHGAHEAAVLAERIAGAVSQPYFIAGNEVSFEVCIGIAIAPDDGTEPGDILKNADLALHRAKTEQRGSTRFFEPGMDARMKARREMELRFGARSQTANSSYTISQSSTSRAAKSSAVRRCFVGATRICGRWTRATSCRCRGDRPDRGAWRMGLPAGLHGSTRVAGTCSRGDQSFARTAP